MKKFRGNNEEVDTTTAMYAYRIIEVPNHNKPGSHCADTTETALSRQQADSLLTITKPLFEQFNLSNVDTVGRVTYLHSDDSGGRVTLHINGQRITVELGALHTSTVSSKAQQFFAVKRFLNSRFAKSQPADLLCP